MGLVALWAMSPKYGDRQLLEERKAQGRMRAAEHASGGEMATNVSSEGNLEIPLQPLFGVLAAVLAFAWAVLWWKHLRPSSAEQAKSESKASFPSPGKDVS